jgi:transcriptional regulator with XRE-family HTH domain
MYCGTVTQPEWPARLASRVAGQIRRWRTERGMSAQQLAEACSRVGLDISRSTLADLENGRRVSLTVAELLVIADALNVPALHLLIPLDNGPVELLPNGNEISPWDALRQIVTDPGNPDDALRLLADHDQLLDIDLQLYRAREHSDRARVADDIRRVRQRMRGQGWEPPPLPKRLLYLEGPVIYDDDDADDQQLREPTDATRS